MDILGTSFCLGLLFLLVQGKRDEELYCTACRILLDELAYAISKVSPDEKIQVGSFRIDPKGNQARYMVPYARSDTHLTELMEHVCDEMDHYSEMILDGHKHIVRTKARDGKHIQFKKFHIKPQVHRKLNFYCENMIEEHEEAINGLLQKEHLPHESVESIFCGEIAEACSVDQLEIPLATGMAEADTPSPEDEEKPEEDTATDDAANDEHKDDDDDKQQNTEREDL